MTAKPWSRRSLPAKSSRCSAANGRRLWADSLSRAGRVTSLSAINDIAGRPVIDGGVVYAASHSGVLAAIDLRTGQRIWARAFASTQTPWVAGDVLYAVSVDGELAAFDRATGNVYLGAAAAPLSQTKTIAKAASRGPARSWSAASWCWRTR